MSGGEPTIIPFPTREPRGTLRLRVDLVLSPRPVWRRLRLDDEASFWDLHVAIQDVMGWSHRHRHLFAVDDPRSGQRLRLGIPERRGYHGRQRVLPSWEVPVADIARPDHPPFLYTYHLGEQWQHEVSLEAREPDHPGHVAPACLDGAGQCPPEGCGGPERWADLVAAGEEAADAFAADEVVFCDPGALWQDRFGDR
jgi:hypothetical protein